MTDTLRATLLLPVLLTTLATAAWAEPEPTTSPLPMIVVNGGKVSLIDPAGTRTLADVRVLQETRFAVGPRRGQVEHHWKPGYVSFLTVHAPTGRWAVSASLMSGEVRLSVNGREYGPPTDKAGRLTKGDFILMGDREGVVSVSTGRPEAWTNDGTFYSQGPEAFTPDGSRVLVTLARSTVCQWWSWSFGPRPVGVRVLPPGMTDTCHAPSPGELRTVLRNNRDGVRIATLDPTGTKPWKVGPPLRQERRKMTAATVLGDTLLFFREGEDLPENNGCELKPGSYRRFELSTGVEHTFHTFVDWCTSGDFLLANPRRRTVYFYGARPDPVDGGERLYEYDLGRDVTRELDIESLHNVHDLSADGRTLLVGTYPKGLVLYDVDSSQVVEVGGIDTKDAWARLLAPR